jgi:hypothetical protein
MSIHYFSSKSNSESKKKILNITPDKSKKHRNIKTRTGNKYSNGCFLLNYLTPPAPVHLISTVSVYFR